MNILDMWAICLSPSVLPENVIPSGDHKYTYFCLICDNHPKKTLAASYLMATTMFNYISPVTTYLVVRGF